MRSVLAGLILSLVCAGAAAAAPASPDRLRIRTAQGEVVGTEQDGVRTFRAIPYAAPPVGALRWRPPQPPAPWSGVRPATAFGPPCPSVDVAWIARGRRVAAGGFDIFLDVPTQPGASEDCLHLNIWAPVRAKRAAVMVWLQPLGAASAPQFDGAAFARDGVVFVNFDYRQLTLGNFAHPALTREAGPNEPLGRFQTLDQMAALRWVKQNIEAFGGDPDNVTIFGLSAGGASTLQLLTLPEAKGLFDKAIVQSGVGWWTPLTLTQMERVGSWMAAQAGLPGGAATAEALRALSPDQLPHLGAYSIDGRFQRENATDAIAAGRLADVPLLIGWTDFDGSSLRSMAPAAYTEQAPPELRAAYADEGKVGADLGYQMYTDAHVGAPARWIARQAADGAPSYLYLFTYVRTAMRGKVRGAAHGDELSYVFDTWEKTYPNLVLSEEDRAATRMVHACWVSFAKTGKPRCPGAPDWPRYTAKDDRLMELGVTPRVLQGFRKTQLDAQEAAWRTGRAAAAQAVEEAVRKLETGGF
ncbi:carboxylesterase/lipase family protein [Phenylobacterium terrae]|uniref:Carboxylic ester hydrolase n=1 Tax=Phenylobacterium terrae TaxID=2665495 RepID=A0ABW4N006_9CAUL